EDGRRRGRQERGEGGGRGRRRDGEEAGGGGRDGKSQERGMAAVLQDFANEGAKRRGSPRGRRAPWDEGRTEGGRRWANEGPAAEQDGRRGAGGDGARGAQRSSDDAPWRREPPSGPRGTGGARGKGRDGDPGLCRHGLRDCRVCWCAHRKWERTAGDEYYEGDGEKEGAAAGAACGSGAPALQTARPEGGGAASQGDARVYFGEGPGPARALPAGAAEVAVAAPRAPLRPPPAPSSKGGACRGKKGGGVPGGQPAGILCGERGRRRLQVSWVRPDEGPGDDAGPAATSAPGAPGAPRTVDA
ncbi:unnamed protein product, partial [Prorocentrum cordatum]